MSQGYKISKTLVESLSQEQLDELCDNRLVVDLGWWARFYGIEGMSEDELRQLFEKDDEELEQEWKTELYGFKKADLLAEYADGFYRGTCDLANCFVKKTVRSDSEALPVLFLFCQFAELALKASIEYMVCFRQELGRPVRKPNLNTHNLAELLLALAALFEPDEPFLSAETQEFICKIHNINELSQGLRYPFSSRKEEEKVFLVDAPVVPMKVFNTELNIHGAELNGFVIWLGQGYIYFGKDAA